MSVSSVCLRGVCKSTFTLLTQPHYSPLPSSEDVVWIWLLIYDAVDSEKYSLHFEGEMWCYSVISIMKQRKDLGTDGCEIGATWRRRKHVKTASGKRHSAALGCRFAYF